MVRAKKSAKRGQSLKLGGWGAASTGASKGASKRPGRRAVSGSRIPVLAGEEAGGKISDFKSQISEKGRKGGKGRQKAAQGSRGNTGGTPVPRWRLYGAAAASAARKRARGGGTVAGGAPAPTAAVRGNAGGAARRERAGGMAGIEYVELRVAVADPPDGVYQTGHVDVQLSPQQTRGFHRLLAGAQGSVIRLRSGKLVGNVGDLVRWIAEQAV